VVIGRLGRAHGLRGALRFWPETDYPERLSGGRPVWIFPPGVDEPAVARPSRLQEVKPLGAGGWWLVTLQGVADRAQAEALVGGTLRVPASSLPALGPGRFYHHQLVGLLVRDGRGTPVGTVTEVLVTGANDVLAVRRPSGGMVYVPATRQAVAAVDLERGELHLGELPGLVDGEGEDGDCGSTS